MPITKLTTLVDKIVEFYETHRWARHALYDGRGFCVLGAASAVLTNEIRLVEDYKKQTRPKHTYAQPPLSFKGIDVLQKFSEEYRKETGLNLVRMNDDAIDKRQVLRNLKTFRKLIA